MNRAQEIAVEVKEITTAINVLSYLLADDLGNHGHDDVEPRYNQYHQGAMLDAIRHLSRRANDLSEWLEERAVDGGAS